MMFSSLRARLIVIILAPLLLIAAGVTLWQYLSETERAKDQFDRGLLSAALSISRDVAVSDGDALSPSTRRLINNTSGGEVFYHVFAPDGVFVTGYSTPPVLPKSAPLTFSEPYFYDARYQDQAVRALRFQYVTTVSEVSGAFSVTVWQHAEVRKSFVAEVVTRSIVITASLVVSVAFIVWFGVGLGLRPLLDLQQAIAERTPTELEPIRRQVPVEAQGIVTTLNALLDRVSRRISSKDEFISNAAHQLRNPVAGVLALAEAVESAPNQDAAKKRSVELLQAARQASRLTNQLLSFERAAGSDLSVTAEDFALNDVLEEVVEEAGSEMARHGVEVVVDLPDSVLATRGDRVMVKEAVRNIVSNALVHGGPGMNLITLSLARDGSSAALIVKDNGVGIPTEKRVQATSRFGQTNAGKGSGLGLPIAIKVLTHHQGRLEILDAPIGTTVKMSFPLTNT